MRNINTTFNLRITWRKINSLYDNYARSVGLNIVSILVLQILSDTQKTHTQKSIGEELEISKQVVNTNIKSFREQGYVEQKRAADHKSKELTLTDKGRQYATQILKPLESAEIAAWDDICSKELSHLLAVADKFEVAFRVALASQKNHST